MTSSWTPVRAFSSVVGADKWQSPLGHVGSHPCLWAAKQLDFINRICFASFPSRQALMMCCCCCWVNISKGAPARGKCLLPRVPQSWSFLVGLLKKINKWSCSVLVVRTFHVPIWLGSLTLPQHADITSSWGLCIFCGRQIMGEGGFEHSRVTSILESFICSWL